jgi:hypothetical protein
VNAPKWNGFGEPANIEAAAEDALLWLDLLARNASVLRMPPGDYLNLIDCRLALVKFSATPSPASKTLPDGVAPTDGVKQ